MATRDEAIYSGVAATPTFANQPPPIYSAPTPGGLNWNPGGGGQYEGGTAANVPGGNDQGRGTPTGDPDPTPNGGGGGGGGGGPDLSGVYAELARLRSALAAMQAAQEKADREAREAASSFLRTLLDQYGMGDLAGSVDNLVKDWGNNTQVIAEKLRLTDSYKTRFKGLLGLQQKGITDVRNEAQYIELESNYRQIFRDSGLVGFLGDPGSVVERDKIADLVSKYSLSVNEVQKRVQDATRVASQTPEDVRNAFRDFYGIEPQMITEYFLDPQGTTNRMNQIANAALIGGYGNRAGLSIDRSTAEQVADLSGNVDIDQGQLTQQLAGIRQMRDSTKRLADIEQTDLSDSELVAGEFGVDQQARRKVRTLQSRERARFSGSSALTQSTLSRAGNI